MKLYKSSFHPDTGDLQNVFGRMTFQVPGGMLVTGAMLQFYQTVPQVLFWQWANQSFNALVCIMSLLSSFVPDFLSYLDAFSRLTSLIAMRSLPFLRPNWAWHM